MSVVGVGTDIIEINRLEQMKTAAREKLAQRVLTSTELQIYQQHHHAIAYLAKRWAAKEAAAKALGTGIAKGVSFQHFVISNTEAGQPILTLTGQALALAKQLGANHWHISLSDEAQYATAFVVLSQ